MTSFLKPRANRYVTADLLRSDVDRQENIEALTFADGSFDVIVCSHILEHVDDAKALKELYRVLRTPGVLLCMVPLVEGWDTTYENMKVSSSSERELHFGQSDHVRFYGRDFRRRLTAAGFALREFTGDGDDAVRYGLLRGETLFVAEKPH